MTIILFCVHYNVYVYGSLILFFSMLCHVFGTFTHCVFCIVWFFVTFSTLIMNTFIYPTSVLQLYFPSLYTASLTLWTFTQCMFGIIWFFVTLSTLIMTIFICVRSVIIVNLNIYYLQYSRTSDHHILCSTKMDP
ncbi:uncharacterized protein LOC105680433 isoform X1 [Bombus impatiens]|uniref:Uncharacterized protein LOC105680433 isoform X1 n=1 Tax=Bombus impatiens TaxID=132113 RepID=A0A6P8LAY6_BOMIM|nr:uncharacterized protein LOC105680433 isoform X1 [Bombus impatiens]